MAPQVFIDFSEEVIKPGLDGVTGSWYTETVGCEPRLQDKEEFNSG